MAWACSQTWCVIARHSRRQDDWETYEREKETTADEQHMRGIGNNKETSWRQMSVMCLSDGSHWPAATAEYQKKKKNITSIHVHNVTVRQTRHIPYICIGYIYEWDGKGRREEGKGNEGEGKEREGGYRHRNTNYWIRPWSGMHFVDIFQ